MMYLHRLYQVLGFSDETPVEIGIRYTGLDGTRLSANGDRVMVIPRTTREDVVEATVRTTVGELDSKTAEVVRAITGPFFMMYDFFEVEPSMLISIVGAYKQGRIT